MVKISHKRKQENLNAVYLNQEKLGENTFPRPNKSYLMSFNILKTTLIFLREKIGKNIRILYNE